jgi:hypothetical protein
MVNLKLFACDAIHRPARARGRLDRNAFCREELDARRRLLAKTVQDFVRLDFFGQFQLGHFGVADHAKWKR